MTAQWLRHKKHTRAPGANVGSGGVPRDMGAKRCIICGQEFRRKRYPCGTWESPAVFEARVACSRSCAAQIGNNIRYGRSRTSQEEES